MRRRLILLRARGPRRRGVAAGRISREGQAQAASRKGGYALPAVLAVLAVLTLVFLSAMTALKSLGDEARAVIDAAEFERIALSAEARAAWLATTEPLAQNQLRVGGLRIPSSDQGDVTRFVTSPATPLMIDGRPYAWSPIEAADASEVISLQDEAGLMNLDYSRQDSLQRLFLRAGASSQEAATLADELLDYTDRDQDRRTDGAEAPEYAAAGRAPPLDAPMNRFDQLFGVLDWRSLMPPARWRRVSDLVDVDPDIAAFNVNTAPQGVLEVVLNLDAEHARAIIARRELKPITAISEIGLTPGEETATYVFPSGAFRFTIRDARRALSYSSTIALTPENAIRPFQVDDGAVSRAATPTPPQAADLGAPPRFPDPIDRPAGP